MQSGSAASTRQALIMATNVLQSHKLFDNDMTDSEARLVASTWIAETDRKFAKIGLTPWMIRCTREEELIREKFVSSQGSRPDFDFLVLARQIKRIEDDSFLSVLPENFRSNKTGLYKGSKLSSGEIELVEQDIKRNTSEKEERDNVEPY